jgi:peptidoglycan/xylan/chitin deacetylase (PgdA/CDA1 family)
MSNAYSAIGSRAGRRWRPAPVVLFSILLHVAAAIALAAHPQEWPWVAGTLVANHLVLVAAVFWPRGAILGANLVRLPDEAAGRHEVCLTFDDGPDPELTPRVLDLLERYGAKASFFCMGEKVSAHPEIVREIVRRGHSVENHSNCHPHAFAFYGIARLRREVDAAQDIISEVTGRAPAFFRAPAGFRSPFLDLVLQSRGLRYVSWTRRGYDTVFRDPARVLRRLTGELAPGDLLLLHDTEPAVIEVLPLLLDQLVARGLRSVSLPSACGDGPTA